MPSLDEVVGRRTDLDAADLDWLRLLASEWHLLADLSFADLVLWLPDSSGAGFWAGAQMRPTTGPTAFPEDLVGTFVPRGQMRLVDQAFATGQICREGDPEYRDDVPVRTEAIPVRRGVGLLGVIARNTNVLTLRTPSRLELAYLETATDLARMIGEGRFPRFSDRRLSSAARLGDGFVRLDAAGLVTYASPNALSVYRRLGLPGDLVGRSLGATTVELVPSDEPVHEAVTETLSGRLPRETTIESPQVSVVLRTIPLTPGGVHRGAAALLRDITQVRRWERELLTKEATIREIHHRVKNNLQTVAALLRMQARRLDPSSGREALLEAVRRVGSIAAVHETLSQAFGDSVPFDDVADAVLSTVVDVAMTAGSRVLVRRDGSFGIVPGAMASSLAMSLSELVQNAVEHGASAADRDAQIVVSPQRRMAGDVEMLSMRVIDDGAGLPADFSLSASANLGLTIVRTLVESELRGRIELRASPAGGTVAEVEIPL